MQLTNTIHFKNLRGDFFGGMTAAIISLPMALAFGVASGVGPTAGLWGAVCVGFFAAFFGGTPTLISEPTGPMTVVMTSVVASLTASDPDNGLAMAFTVVMMAGVFQLVFGVLKLGKYITLMPYTVISGFMTGIGVIMVVLQLGPFLGQPNPGGGVLGTLQALPDLLRNLQPAELALGAMTLAVLFFTPLPIRRWVPPQLLALVVGTLVSLVFFANLDIEIIGEIPLGLPTLQMPSFTAAQLQVMVVDAIILGMLGCIDSLLTSVIADSLTRTQHDSDKELIGQGLGNIVSGLCGGLPGAGATMGTVVNIQSGGRTALSGLIRSGILLVVILGASPLVHSVPQAVLAAITIRVGLNIIDWSFLKRAHHVSFRGTIIMYGVVLLTVFVDLITAVGVGVFVANILTIQRLSDIQSQEVKAITDADDEIHLDEEEKTLLRQAEGRVLLFHLSGPMIFGVAKAIAREHTAVDACDVLILDLHDVPLLGVTASLAIENAIRDAHDKGIQIYVAGASAQVLSRLERLGLFTIINPDHILESRTEALRQAVGRVHAKAAVV